MKSDLAIKVFAEDLEVLPDGTEVMSESIIGAIWVISPSGVISPGLFPDNPGVPIPQLGPCEITTTTVGGVPFEEALEPAIELADGDHRRSRVVRRRG